MCKKVKINWDTNTYTYIHTLIQNILKIKFEFELKFEA